MFLLCVCVLLLCCHVLLCFFVCFLVIWPPWIIQNPIASTVWISYICDFLFMCVCFPLLFVFLCCLCVYLLFGRKQAAEPNIGSGFFYLPPHHFELFLMILLFTLYSLQFARYFPFLNAIALLLIFKHIEMFRWLTL